MFLMAPELSPSQVCPHSVRFALILEICPLALLSGWNLESSVMSFPDSPVLFFLPLTFHSIPTRTKILLHIFDREILPSPFVA